MDYNDKYIKLIQNQMKRIEMLEYIVARMELAQWGTGEMAVSAEVLPEDETEEKTEFLHE